MGELSPHLEEGVPSDGAGEVRPKWGQPEWEEKASRGEVERASKEVTGLDTGICPISSVGKLSRGDWGGEMESNMSQRKGKPAY